MSPTPTTRRKPRPARRGRDWLLVLGGVSLLAGCASPPPDADLVLHRARVVDPEGSTVSDESTLYIRDGRIVERTQAARAAPGDARVVDLAGRYVIPGLWDAHVHLGSDTARVFGRLIPGFLGHGITQLRDMGGTPEALAQLRRALFDPDRGPVPLLLAAGPLIDSEAISWYGDLQLVLQDSARVAGAVEDLQAAGVDLLKAYSGLTPPVYAALLAAGEGLALPVDGHVPHPVGLQGVVAGSQRTIEHVDIAAFRSCTDDGAGWFQRGLTARFQEGPEAVAELMAGFWDAVDWDRCTPLLEAFGARGGAWTPTVMMELASFDYVAESHFAYTDEGAAGWCRDQLAGVDATTPAARRAMTAGFRDALDRIRAAGITILAGTDLPNRCNFGGVTLASELQLLVELGMTPGEALAAATVNPARVFGLEDRGRIAPGFVADLVVLADDPLQRVAAVAEPEGLVLGGRYLDAAELVRLRDQAAGRFTAETPTGPGSTPAPDPEASDLERQVSSRTAR